MIFLTDNGHSVPGPFNAGLRAAKATVYHGGVRVPSFWRWPGRWEPGDRPQMAAHVDVFRTLAELAGAPVPDTVRPLLEGRSRVPTLENPRVPWPDRVLVSHLGHWKTGGVANAKFTHAAIRNARVKLVNHVELYDLQSDPAESRNVLDAHPQVVSDLRAANDRWWAEIPPNLENELARGPAINPFKARYWAQFGGGPTEAFLRRMDPERKFTPAP